MKISGFLSVFLLLFVLGCGPSRRASSGKKEVSATITREGFINCFEKGLSLGGQPIWCEASAIYSDGKQVMLANDKDMPDKRTSVFVLPYSKQFPDTSAAAKYLLNTAFKKAKKFEDFAFSPDNKLVFLTTAFDRVKPDSKDWDGYNTIFYWRQGEEQQPYVLTSGSDDTTSISLRPILIKALNDVPYFKIEGLAATADRLYFGIREEGKKFDDFNYRFKIISTGYAYTNGRVTLSGNFETVANIDLPALHPELEKGMGLSSIEYDHYHKRFLILSSFESPEKMRGYLWSATEEELRNGKVNLVKTTTGNPLKFMHKPEDLTFVSRNRILVVHDDDRLQTKVGELTRQPSQAAYSIVDF